MKRTDPATSPLLSGLVLLGLGLAMRKLQPSILDMPRREHGDGSKDSRTRRAARYTRDGVSKAMPGNLAGAVGRTFVIAGAGLIAVRALDLIVEDDDVLL